LKVFPFFLKILIVAQRHEKAQLDAIAHG
jgi:hypothetical protein